MIPEIFSRFHLLLMLDQLSHPENTASMCQLHMIKVNFSIRQKHVMTFYLEKCLIRLCATNYVCAPTCICVLEKKSYINEEVMITHPQNNRPIRSTYIEFRS